MKLPLLPREKKTTKKKHCFDFFKFFFLVGGNFWGGGGLKNFFNYFYCLDCRPHPPLSHSHHFDCCLPQRSSGNTCWNFEPNNLFLPQGYIISIPYAIVLNICFRLISLDNSSRFCFLSVFLWPGIELATVWLKSLFGTKKTMLYPLVHVSFHQTSPEDGQNIMNVTRKIRTTVQTMSIA